MTPKKSNDTEHIKTLRAVMQSLEEAQQHVSRYYDIAKKGKNDQEMIKRNAFLYIADTLRETWEMAEDLIV